MADPDTDADRLLTIDQASEAGRYVLRVEGEVDLATAGQLEAALGEAGRATGDVLVDLTATTFMDSTGLKCLVVGQRDLAEADRELVVVVPPGPVARLVDVSGIAATIRVVSDRSELGD